MHIYLGKLLSLKTSLIFVHFFSNVIFVCVLVYTHPPAHTNFQSDGRTTKMRRTPLCLFRAIRKGDLGGVEAALRDGASVDSTTTAEEGEFDNLSAGLLSALMLAIEVGGGLGIVKLLLERGADVHWARPHNNVAVRVWGVRYVWCVLCASVAGS